MQSPLFCWLHNRLGLPKHITAHHRFDYRGLCKPNERSIDLLVWNSADCVEVVSTYCVEFCIVGSTVSTTCLLGMVLYLALALLAQNVRCITVESK
jgi:hypothetical protein